MKPLNAAADPVAADVTLDHPVQAIMSRTGSFPLRVAVNLLQTHAQDGAVVLDPFCGKGTSLLAARLLGHASFGADIAPEAVACSRAKLADVSLSSVTDYLRPIRVGRPSLAGVPKTVLGFFNEDTLRQILSLRSRFFDDLEHGTTAQKANASFCLACLLGILHGHASYSLSLPCAHAYAMAPGYVARYAAKHELTPPLQDVKACLLKKAMKVLRVPLPTPVPSDVRLGSALSCTTLYPDLVGKVDLILTSPPYLNAQTYAKDNWLRLWLLNHDFRALRPTYIETGSISRYEELMKRAFCELKKMLKPDGLLICIAGDVRLSGGTHHSNHRTVKTGNLLLSICEAEPLAFRRQGFDKHRVPSNARYYHALSQSNGHSEHQLIERIFVARKTTRE